MAEARILKTLEGTTGFAQIYWQGNENRCNFMVTDLLGPSL
jgi:predicted Ser/Thr protein kinase